MKIAFFGCFSGASGDMIIGSLVDAGLSLEHLRDQIKKLALLTLVSSMDKVGLFSDFLLRETTTIGLRWRIKNRIKAHRSIDTLETEHGPVRIKIAESAGKIINISHEYYGCKKLALEKKFP